MFMFLFNIFYVVDVEMRTYFNKKSYPINNKSNILCKFAQFYLSYYFNNNILLYT